MYTLTRRDFLRTSAGAIGGVLAAGTFGAADSARSPLKISLAQWSLHRTLYGASTTADRFRGLSPQEVKAALRDDPKRLLRGSLDPLDFAAHARRTFDIDAVEYVNTFYFGRARDERYLAEMKRRADGEGVTSVLIMCDLEGDLGDPNDEARTAAVEAHCKWVEAAAFLGCHAIRVNAGSRGSPQEQLRLTADGLHRLGEYGAKYDIDILVENHGGLSSNAQWLAAVIRASKHSRVGTLPDFGNFRVSETETYDPYRGVAELMPYAKGVSAKSHDFAASGEETALDYRRLLRIVLAAGYRGYLGIEYEGERLSEEAGIRATKRLIERVLGEIH